MLPIGILHSRDCRAEATTDVPPQFSDDYSVFSGSIIIDL